MDLSSILSGATREFDNVLKTSVRVRRQDADIINAAANGQVDFAALLQNNDLASLISGIDVATFDNAIPSVDLASLIPGGTINLADSTQLETLANALQDVDLSAALENFVS